MRQTRHLIYLSLLVASAMVLSLIERNIPVPFMIPGAKLGLANLITLLALYSLPSKKDVIMIITARLLLTSIFCGSMSGLMYGSVGAYLSFVIMILIKRLLKDKVSIIGVSAAGAVFHNIGQVIVSMYIVKNIGVALYLPFLSILGIATGIFNGIVANYSITYIKRIPALREALFNNER